MGLEVRTPLRSASHRRRENSNSTQPTRREIRVLIVGQCGAPPWMILKCFAHTNVLGLSLQKSGIKESIILAQDTHELRPNRMVPQTAVKKNVKRDLVQLDTLAGVAFSWLDLLDDVCEDQAVVQTAAQVAAKVTLFGRRLMSVASLACGRGHSAKKSMGMCVRAPTGRKALLAMCCKLRGPKRVVRRGSFRGLVKRCSMRATHAPLTAALATPSVRNVSDESRIGHPRRAAQRRRERNFRISSPRLARFTVSAMFVQIGSTSDSVQIAIERRPSGAQTSCFRLPSAALEGVWSRITVLPANREGRQEGCPKRGADKMGDEPPSRRPLDARVRCAFRRQTREPRGVFVRSEAVRCREHPPPEEPHVPLRLHLADVGQAGQGHGQPPRDAPRVDVLRRRREEAHGARHRCRALPPLRLLREALPEGGESEWLGGLQIFVPCARARGAAPDGRPSDARAAGEASGA